MRLRPSATLSVLSAFGPLLPLQPVHGAFGLVFTFADQPDLLIGCRRGSPLIVGVGEGEYFLASDASAVIVSPSAAVGLGQACAPDGQLRGQSCVCACECVRVLQR